MLTSSIQPKMEAAGRGAVRWTRSQAQFVLETSKGGFIGGPGISESGEWLNYYSSSYHLDFLLLAHKLLLTSKYPK